MQRCTVFLSQRRTAPLYNVSLMVDIEQLWNRIFVWIWGCFPCLPTSQFDQFGSMLFGGTFYFHQLISGPKHACNGPAPCSLCRSTEPPSIARVVSVARPFGPPTNTIFCWIPSPCSHMTCQAWIIPPHGPLCFCWQAQGLMREPWWAPLKLNTLKRTHVAYTKTLFPTKKLGWCRRCLQF